VKITGIEALHLRLPEVREIADGTQDCLLVCVHTDSGLTGLGEVVSCSYAARAVIAAPRSAPFRHGLAAIAVGMDALDAAAVFAALVAGTSWYGPGGVVHHAISGIDLALWDLRGKAAGLPVRRLLCRDAADAVPCYASALWPDRPECVEASAREFAAAGYRAVKYGWGPMGKDIELDVALVAAARAGLGPQLQLMVDAGRCWDVDQALRRAERFAAYGVAWLEEPLRPRDLQGYRILCDASPIPIAAGEALALLDEYEQLLATGHVHVVQPDLARAGGLTQAQQIAALARETGARCVPHAFGTGVLLAASAQWAAAGPAPLVEYTQAPSPLARRLARHRMAFSGGRLHLDDAPGWGVELDPEIVSRYRVS